MSAVTTPTSSEAAPRSTPLHVARLIARDIKLAHSVFALPFALLGAFLAGPFPDASAGAWRWFLVQLALILVCMVAARTWAMVVNRLADRSFDAENQRTSRRVFASGQLTQRHGVLTLTVCAAVFVVATSFFYFLFKNPWPVALSLPVLAYLALYSFTKRFTMLCHIVLGTALAASPMAAALAVNPEFPALAPAVFWIAGFVACWVAGFDIIYALQDRDFDRERSLHSIPAALGTHGAMWISRILHFVGAVCLGWALWLDLRFGPLFFVGFLGVLALLMWEHRIVARLVARSDADLSSGPPSLNMAFFTLNGVVSVLVGLFGIVDIAV